MPRLVAERHHHDVVPERVDHALPRLRERLHALPAARPVAHREQQELDGDGGDDRPDRVAHAIEDVAERAFHRRGLFANRRPKEGRIGRRDTAYSPAIDAARPPSRLLASASVPSRAQDATTSRASIASDWCRVEFRPDLRPSALEFLTRGGARARPHLGPARHRRRAVRVTILVVRDSTRCGPKSSRGPGTSRRTGPAGSRFPALSLVVVRADLPARSSSTASTRSSPTSSCTSRSRGRRRPSGHRHSPLVRGRGRAVGGRPRAAARRPGSPAGRDVRVAARPRRR